MFGECGMNVQEERARRHFRPECLLAVEKRQAFPNGGSILFYLSGACLQHKLELLLRTFMSVSEEMVTETAKMVSNGHS